MSKISLQPTDDHVVLKMDEKRGEHLDLKSGLYVPATGEEAPIFGTVLSVGPGTQLDNGERIPLIFETDDRVVVPKYAGAAVTIEGTEYIIVRASEILAVVVEDA